MISLQAVSYSEILLRQALRSSGIFHLHSVFPTGINLKCGQRLVYLGAEDKGTKPFGIVFNKRDFFQLQHIVKHCSWGIYHASGKKFQWDIGESICLENAVCFATQLTHSRNPASSLQKIRLRLEDACSRLENQQAMGLSRSEVEQHTSLIAQVFTGDGISSIPALDFWVGRGPGLTPSGDDILLGMLASLHWGGQVQYSWNLRTYLDNRGQSRTTDVSCEYLYYAVRGHFSKEIADFLFALEHVDSWSEALDTLLQHGHTSGADTVLGLYLGMELLSRL